MQADLRFDPNETALFTDLYELTMAASYFEIGFNESACFTMSSRPLPARRGFLVAAGLERLLEALEEFRFEQPIQGMPRIKTSQHKLSLPGRKQVFRGMNAGGDFYADLIGLADEDRTTVSREFAQIPVAVGTLLKKHFTAGHRIGSRPTLPESRERLRESMAKLDQRYKELEPPGAFPVGRTVALDAMLTRERSRVAKCQD